MVDEGLGDEEPIAGRLIGRVRKTRIAELVREQGFMSPADLSQLFDVSEMTIRRDLAELSMRGEIQRIHGGAISERRVIAEESAPARPFADSTFINRERKQRIARAALAQIKPAQAVAIDTGTTTYELACAMLGSENPVRIFTNNLRVASLPVDGSTEIYLLGGRLRDNNRALGGPVAIEQARKLWFDTALISVSSVARQGFFDSSIEETDLKRLYIERATRRIVLADSSKFDTMALVQVAPLNQCDLLISDAPPPPDLASALTAAGVEIIVAAD